ncbi:hypothetical protein E1B28_003867 [Marasmius oreades]|uniref:tRNA-splicing endonuclease subunit Sen54 N-terminal domain-containing protein n=1 Tax=Marasmius oreades TaxID=181124 RepID=A0A9P7UXG0_9AGAR|nr:uncharacterized protein E1B28_003867 [Marasmius oreades]KAG7096430.1 hypothetical protein E1B28_003867 [Marasmius oreades]
MDDSLAHPSSELKKPQQPNDDVGEDQEESGDEDEGTLDWTKLLPASARPIIPKRGEKEFEPSVEGGSNLQQHILNRSRNAMFDALKATRTISQKSLCYGIYHPSLSRVSVPIARGQVINTLGHSVPRPTILPDGSNKIQKRLELLPEEAIYLIERGSLFCWKESDVAYGGESDNYPFEIVGGAPMAVQQAFSEMIGKEGLSLEKYQVYSYLKRLGYSITRTHPPNEHYPTADPFPYMKLPVAPPHPQTIMKRAHEIFRIIPDSVCKVLNWVLGKRGFTWWRPLSFGRWICGRVRYGDIFKQLRFIPAGHSVPLYTPPQPITTEPQTKPESPYKFFYNVYKPPTPFKKSAPGPPDYQIAVVNARTTLMPTLHELTALYDISPELPVPVPKYKRPSPPGQPPRGPNPFSALRAGKKTVVVAVVDAGNVGFFRFAQGEWGEWPMVS